MTHIRVFFWSNYWMIWIDYPFCLEFFNQSLFMVGFTIRRCPAISRTEPFCCCFEFWDFHIIWVTWRRIYFIWVWIIFNFRMYVFFIICFVKAVLQFIDQNWHLGLNTSCISVIFYWEQPFPDVSVVLLFDFVLKVCNRVLDLNLTAFIVCTTHY